VSPRRREALLLFGTADRRLNAALTALAAALLAWSRFAFLARGPWEWDETLFARGILHFELAAHFPHPPGFPGWLAIGHLLTPFTGDPLRALQLASAAFSVAALWVLAALGRRVAPAPVAVLAALALLAAPGPWLYAVRGFSTTAASVLALAAAAVLAGGLAGRRATAFTVLVAAAFLVRPILLPPLALLWLGGAATVRPSRRLLPGIAIAVTAGGVAVALMAWAEGGVGAFLAPFLAHSQRHFSRLVANPGGFSELGLVKGLGGVVPATLVALAALAGLAAWARRLTGRAAALWLAVLLVATAQLVLLQNRSYGRYAVGVQMALAPLLAGTAAALPMPAACLGLAGLAAWYGAGSLPLVAEQHATELPGFTAVREARAAALAGGRTVVLEPELHPFASYLWHLAERRGEANPPWVLSPWAPEPWQGVSGPWLVATVHRRLYPDSLFGIERRFSGVSAALEPLTQQRMLEAWILEDVPLPLAGWWPAELAADGRRFTWGGAEAELLLPPLRGDAELGLALRPAPGPAAVELRWNGRLVAAVEGEGGERRLRLTAAAGVPKVASTLRFSRARTPFPTGSEPRALSFQLFELRAIDGRRAWTGSLVHARDRDALGVELEGGYAPETFEGGLAGLWLGPRARLVLPASVGTLEIELAAPRPTSPRCELRLGDRLAAGPLELGPRPELVTVEVGAGEAPGGRLELVIASQPYRPAAHGLADQRELGVVLAGVAFRPAAALDGRVGGP
jgi:hypothetical protein